MPDTLVDPFTTSITDQCRRSSTSTDNFERKLSELVLISLSDRLSDCGCVVTLLSFLLESEQRGELEGLCHVLATIVPSIMKPEPYQQPN